MRVRGSLNQANPSTLTPAAHRLHPLAAVVAVAIFLLLNASFLRLLARSIRNRRQMQATIASARAATAAARAATSVDVAFTGTWTKDTSSSDSMDAVLDLMRVGGLPRAAITLVRGIELRVTRDVFEMAAFSPIPLLKVKERYSLTGTPSIHRRRDLRGMGATGRTVRTTRGGGFCTVLAWGAPVAGECVDTYAVAGDVLMVTSTVKVEAGSVTYRTVYRRKV